MEIYLGLCVRQFVTSLPWVLYRYLDVRFAEIERRLSALEGKTEVKQ
jgi:hypothetical protein